MRSKKVLVIVPAYNESASIQDVVRSVYKESVDYACVVVNDGSCDNTGELALAAGAIVLDLPTNLGIGGAVQTGFKYAQREGYPFAVQFDGDGQHLSCEIGKLIKQLEVGFDVCIGSRFIEKTDGFQSTRIRRIGIYIFELINRVLIHRRVTDSTSGFRAYNRSAIEYLAKNYPTDYPEPEAVIELVKAGFNLSEVAVRMKERQGGESSISSWKSVYYMVKVSLSMFMAYWRLRKDNGKC